MRLVFLPFKGEVPQRGGGGSYLVKTIAILLGRIFGFILPDATGSSLTAFHNYLYTGYVAHRFKAWGPHSAIKATAEEIVGADSIEIGADVLIGSHIRLTAWQKEGKGACIKIGDNTRIGDYSHLTALTGITIGRGFLSGTNLLITDNAHGATDIDSLHQMPISRELVSKGPVTIGDNVWCGNNVCILPGVTIGEGAVIAAGSVVTHDIPAYSVCAGIPASVIK